MTGRVLHHRGGGDGGAADGGAGGGAACRGAPDARKTYLGDGAYAELDRYGDLVLTTENGISVTNRIVLGAVEYQTLVDFVNRWQVPPAA
jgi:hypothetical protein